MRNFTILLSCVWPLLISQPVLAWGDTGHAAICEIAFLELTPPARAKVRALMRRDEEFALFSKSCSWMDHPRKRGDEHFVNVKRDATKIGERPCPNADKCVVSAILNDMRDLAFSQDEDEQLRLLKSLGHWLGDIHQPLHVSFEDDRGGNSVDVEGPCGRNLHGVWDGCVIEEKIGSDARTIAIELRAEISAADRAAWIPASVDTASVTGWANESLVISLSPETQYCVQKDGECWYEGNRREFRQGEPMRTVAADDGYLTRQAPIVRQRMKMAGVRLGAMLNTIFAPAVAERTPAPMPGSLDREPRPRSPAAPGTPMSAEDAQRLSQRIESLERAITALTREIARLRAED